MPALPPYIPPQQAKFTAWLANFAALIFANPAMYGLTSGDATTIAGYNTTWIAAYTPVTSPATKTPAAVSAKNTAYATLLPLIRIYAQQIARNPGVTSDNKIALGLNPQTSQPTPVSAPTSNPVLVVQSASAGSIVLRYRDSAASVSVKAKPYGAIACQLYQYQGVAAPTDIAQFSKAAVATKSPFVVDTTKLVSGSTIWFSAVWQTRRGLASPPAPFISTVVV